jgi:DNA-nicking Smr family endonuclease
MESTLGAIMQDEDNSAFMSQMQGVKRIQVDRADTGKPRNDRQQIANRRQHAATSSAAVRVDGLSDQFVIDVGPEDELYWTMDGVQEAQMRKLKAGQIPFEGSIDLHGLTVENARQQLWEFFDEGLRLEVRCVRVTHGKAARKDGRRPLIKSHVNTWLRQHPQVLGFVSCAPRHGGTGAVYVLLRRKMLEGRDE